MQCIATINFLNAKQSGQSGVRRNTGLRMAATLPPGDAPDPDLVDALAAQSGDADAFVRLVRRHESNICRLLLRFTDDRMLIQDLCQETYLEAYRSLHRFRLEGSFAGWLRRIALRVGYRFWGRQAREAKAKIAYAESRRCDCESVAQSYDLDAVDAMHHAVEHLGACDQTLIDLRYFKGLKATEIAAQLGWTVTRVRVRLHRAIKFLRKDDLPLSGFGNGRT